MKRLFVVALAVLFLAGCATEQKFDQGMRTYIGQPVDNVVARVGPPHRTHTNTDGSQVLTWEDKRQYDGVYGMHFFECTLTLFVTKNGVITNYTRQGNSCKA